MSPLTHKLLRDLWRMKGQAIAIGLVIAMGVMLQVMMSGLVTTLESTRDAYYDRYRLTDVFAPVARAPSHMMPPLSEINGVARVQSRVVGAALVDIPDRAAPVQARAVSLPENGTAALNATFLSAGRMPDPARPDEILLVEGFAKAHGLAPGDTLLATLNGTRRALQVVGLAQSPEFLYIAAPGEMVPDDSRFGVIWMGRDAMAALFDMGGAFNEALFALTRAADKQVVLAEIDRILDPWGGRGAYGIEDQYSNQFVTEEINGLRSTANTVPPLFLAVAAFLLYIVIGRIVQFERNNISLLQAFGYSNAEVGAHYLKLVLVIAAGGAILGCLLGIAGGRAMVQLYLQYFKFPFLLFRLDPASFAIGVTASILAASGGGLLVLRRVFALTPADAMHPPAPADYSRSGRIGQSIARLLDQPSRMVLRRITRQPLRMGGAMIGIACGMALSGSMLSTFIAFEDTLDTTFTVVDRSDLTISFAGPIERGALHEIATRDGVWQAEPVRFVPAILRNGRHTHRGSIQGQPTDARLSRAIDSDKQAIPMREDGLILSTTLAAKLDIRAGDRITVEVRDGRRPTLELPVAAIADSFFGTPAFIELDALNRALKEPGRVTGAYLRIDPGKRDEITEWLKGLPMVAGVTIKAEAESAFRKVMNEGAGSSRYVMGVLAFVITYGIVYNAARIAHAERARDLASLRVLGFSKGETAFVLLGELAVITLVALPIGTLLGHGLSQLIMAAYSTDIYTITLGFEPSAYGNAALVVLSAALISGLLVKRDLDRADLISALKTRE